MRATDEEGEAWQKARDWLPEAMQFAAIDPDAPEDDGAEEDEPLESDADEADAAGDDAEAEAA